MRGEAGTVEEISARIAGAAHGVVTREQLLNAGISGGGIDRRIKRGSLLPVHRGVYRVGHRAPSREARYLAAVLACGDGALLAGRAAAHLWKLIKGPPPEPEVLALTARRIPGVIVHRARRGYTNGGPGWASDAGRCQGIPVTTVPRTLVDLASALPERALARACHEADVLYGVTPVQVDEVLARRPSSAGAGRLRSLLGGDERITLSPLERRFLQHLREAGLPLPQTNRPLGGRRVDCHWPDRRLTVELDGYRYHRSRHAWEQDRRREREARARGEEFRRYTYGDVVEDPVLMLRELRALLA